MNIEIISIFSEFFFSVKNHQQLLFEVFSDIMRIFSKVELQTESTFHFSTIFETYVTSHALKYHKLDFSKSSFQYGMKLDKIYDKMIPYPAKSSEKS